jgi:hypothetical protein
MRFETKGSKEKNKKLNLFCELESFFFSYYFFITRFPLHFQNNF